MPRTLERDSPCKVNLLLNILGRRSDGFHELETVMHPVGICDRLAFERGGNAVELTCTDPALPVDAGNLVHRAATSFLEAAGIGEGVRIHLDKKIPMAAGLGGGSGDAAVTLSGLNELFDRPLGHEQLADLAASLGSDVPFFLHSQPALATGRGEKLTAYPPFPAMRGAVFLLVHPGFGISTAWSYQNLARFPEALNGKPGRAGELVRLLETASLAEAGARFYNALEAPALEKFPLLTVLQEFLLEQGAVVALMSGSGSTTFALLGSRPAAQELGERVKSKFGAACWIAVAPV
jgi:4-diphosphocytidyl-2-C-methyl-D-erythritol kinase